MKLLNLAFNLLNTASSATSEGATSEELISEGGALGLTFEPQRFLEMLEYMGKGMLIIFVLIGVIVLVTMLVNKIFSKK